MSGLKGQPKKGGVEKKTFNLKAFKNNNNLAHKVIEKEVSYIPMSEAYSEATNMAGLVRGYVHLMRGHSNTGKSTAIYEGVAGAQKIGDLPVIIETEGNWSWEHAKNIGVQFEEVVDEETGEIDYEGDFILVRAGNLLSMYGKYDYSSSKEASKFLRTEAVIEDVQRFIEELLLAQTNGDLPRNLAFFWDSIGVLNCFKSTQSKSSNNQWNAGAMSACFGVLLNTKIPNSRLVDSEYTNTFTAVQKIWMEANAIGQPTVRHKGGDTLFYSARVIVHFGGHATNSITMLNATSSGKTFNYGIQTKIKVVKNHTGGLTEEGLICSTSHGYVSPNKLDEYKKEHREFFKQQLETNHALAFKEFEVINED